MSPAEVEMLKRIGSALVKELQAEIIAQGHVSTGKLRDSFEFKFSVENDAFVVEVLSEDYGTFVDSGRQIGARRVPIEDLERWIRQRNFEVSGDKEIRSLAFAIQRTIFEEGIPTRGSVRFSTTGKRTDFISQAEPRALVEAEKAIDMAIDELLNGAWERAGRIKL